MDNEKTVEDCVHLENLNENLEKELSNFRDKLEYLESDNIRPCKFQYEAQR